MAVRVFDGVNDSISWNNPPNLVGAFTIAALIKRTVNTAYHAIGVEHDSSSNPVVTAMIASQALDSNHPTMEINGNSSSLTTMVIAAADGWDLVIWSKASGTQLPRMHKLPQGSFGTPASMTHENGTNSLANAPSHPGGTFRLGEYNAQSWFAGKCALIGIWASQLSDANCQALATNLNVSDWTGHAVTAARVWRPGDSAPTDLKGSGDTPTINGGATIDTGDDPPGWTLGAAGTTYTRSGLVVVGP